MKYTAEIVEELRKLRHLPTAITYVWNAGQSMQFQFLQSLSLFFGALVLQTLSITLLYRLTDCPWAQALLMFVTFTLMRFWLQFFSQGLGYLIQICDSYERNSKVKVSQDQANQISNLFAKQSTRNTESDDFLRNIQKSGSRSFSDIVVVDQKTLTQRRWNPSGQDSGCLVTAGTTHPLC